MDMNRRYGAKDKPWPVRVAADGAAAAEIVKTALATLATANAASRLNFSWRAHEAASSELTKVLAAPRDDIREVAMSASDAILAACVKGVKGLRKLTAVASMRLILVRLPTFRCP